MLSLSLSLCFSVARSLPLTLCLLWLLANRFHMLLQLTSVLNYFTCDLRYFLRKSVIYLLKTNKTNLSCYHFTFLCLVFSFFPFLPLYCVADAVVLLLEAINITNAFSFFFFRRQFPSIHKKRSGSDSSQVGSMWAAGGLPLPLSPCHIDFLVCSYFTTFTVPLFILSKLDVFFHFKIRRV